MTLVSLLRLRWRHRRRDGTTQLLLPGVAWGPFAAAGSLLNLSPPVGVAALLASTIVSAATPRAIG